MWFLGLIVGAIIGAIGGGAGAVIGACVGLAAGVVISQSRRSRDEQWKADLRRQLQDMQLRIEALERRGHITPVAAPEPIADTAASPLVAAATNEPFADVPDDRAAAHSPEAQPVLASASVDTGAEIASPGATEARTRSASKRAPADNPIARWLFGGNTLVRVGIVLLFFGVAFLVKYAAERDLVPIELRLAGVALGGIALLVVGWRLRAQRAGYALALQGGGIGVLYLAVFAAFRLYPLLPALPAFVLLIAIAVSAAMLAVLQDAKSLAVTGVIGGFLAPVLASTGSGSHVALFSFYAVLNCGILGVAWHKAWRELNLVGFAFTFVIGLAWGANYYRPALFASTEPFLVFFFLLYVGVAVLFALRRAPELTHYVDGSLVFGTPLVAFGLQAALVRDLSFGAAWSAFALGAFYLTLATALYARKRDSLRLLVESFLALGVGFATLAIPLAFDGRWTSAVWAVEGAAIVWIGVRQERRLARAFGILLQFAAGIAFLLDTHASAGLPVLNSLYLGTVMVSGAALFCSYYLRRHAERVRTVEIYAARALFVWGVLWWFGGGIAEIDRQIPDRWGLHPHLLLFGASCALFGALWRRFDWNAAGLVTLSAVPLGALIALLMVVPAALHTHPFAHHAYLGWMLLFAVHLWALRVREEQTARWLARMHSAGAWLLTVIVSWEIAWQIDRYVDGDRVWPLVGWVLAPIAFTSLLAVRGERLGWLVSTHRAAYLYGGTFPSVAFLYAWLIGSNFVSDGNPAPLPYVPFLSPLDIAQAGALLTLASWYVAARKLERIDAPLPPQSTALGALAAAAFVCLNGVLLRGLHHYADIPFRLEAMLRSDRVQMAFSLLWTTVALAAMIVAARRGRRALWLVGGALFGLVVAKLFLVDLSNVGTVERWVSFIGVGVLAIVIGYFAPVPPKAAETAEATP